MDDLVLLDKIKEKLQISKNELPFHLKESLLAYLNKTNESFHLKSKYLKTRKQKKDNTSKTFTRKYIPKKNHHTRKKRNKKIGKRTYTRKKKY